MTLCIFKPQYLSSFVCCTSPRFKQVSDNLTANNIIHFLLFQTSFPGNLHLVLVLRPTGLLSTTPSPSSSTDLGFRFSQDDFLLKMPVRGGTKLSSQTINWSTAAFNSVIASLEQFISQYSVQHRPSSCYRCPVALFVCRWWCCARSATCCATSMKTTWHQTSLQKWNIAKVTGSSSARYVHLWCVSEVKVALAQAAHFPMVFGAKNKARITRQQQRGAIHDISA